MITPTLMTPDQVAALTPDQRIARVKMLVTYGHQLLDSVIAAEEAKTWKKDGSTRTVAGVAVLFSGGNDSTTLAHMFRDRADWAIHANTTIGIEETRQYVRDTCESWGLQLIEKKAPISYRELVLEQGFPGPGHHGKMYNRIKERCFRQARKEIIGRNGRSHRVIFLAGRRRMESARRANVPEVDYDDAVVYVSPLVYWTKLDIATYRAMCGDVPRNEVADTLHMSGECLCGAFAHEGELDEIEYWFPHVAKEIRELEAEVRATGKFTDKPHLEHWGHGQGRKGKSGRLCTNCVARSEA